MVQDEGSAKFSAMPDSAGATGLADYVLPPAEMARELLLFIRHPLVAHAKDAAFKVGETTMQKIVSLIHEQTGIDFTSYKQSTVARRIQRRIGIAPLANPRTYLAIPLTVTFMVRPVTPASCPPFSVQFPLAPSFTRFSR